MDRCRLQCPTVEGGQAKAATCLCDQSPILQAPAKFKALYKEALRIVEQTSAEANAGEPIEGQGDVKLVGAGAPYRERRFAMPLRGSQVAKPVGQGCQRVERI